MNKNSKIYIAGHKGLVGSALLDSLKNKGYTNLVVRTHDELDLTNQLEVARFFKSETPEYIFLAAAKVGGIYANNTYRADFIYENLMIQNNVIHQAFVHGIKKLLFLGSTCIYPKDCRQPMKEEYLLTNTLEYTNEPYAIAKIAGIKMCESYNLQYGTNFIAVQPTNLYGPNDSFDLEKSHVLSALIRKIHLGKGLENNDWVSIRKDLNRWPIEGVTENNTNEEILSILEKHGVRHNLDNNDIEIEIWGSGHPMREFLWSEDLADACTYLMEHIDFKDIAKDIRKRSKTDESIEIRNTHINIGTGKDISIRELADLIKKIINFNGVMFYNLNKPNGTMKKLTNSSKLHTLGWKHSVELKEGIGRMYDWYVNDSGLK